MKRNSFKDRLLEKCIPEPNSGCWLWLGSATAKGYGHMWFRDRYVKAHRISFILFKRELMPGEVVCHRCDNPSCVNPEHLWSGSTADNIADCIRKGRDRRGVLFGAENPQTKLSDEALREIVIAPWYYGVNRDLAKRFGVHQGYVCHLRRAGGRL